MTTKPQDDESNAAQPAEKAEVPRRNLVASLLALAGSGAALSMLSGCVGDDKGGDGELVAAASEALHGDASQIAWVDTVLGDLYLSNSSSPFSRDHGDLATNSSVTLAQPNGPHVVLAVALGCVYRHDGGGGL